MNNSLSLFKRNVDSVSEIFVLYDYLTNTAKIPLDFDDLLRSQIVYSVSAFDKLVHDLVRIGMLEIFAGNRLPTQKYLSESFSMSTINQFSAATVPPKEYYFEQEVLRKLKIVSYQDPDKVADGLSYIWNEPHKWQKIAAGMGLDEKSVKTKLKLIIDRRNKIAHEADFDPVIGNKYTINKTECESTISFLQTCGEEIAKLVI